LLIVDILITIGSISFLLAGIRQLKKLLRIHKTDGISATYFKLRIIAIACIISGYIIACLPLSVFINSLALIIDIVILILIAKYRRKTLWDV
jgi:uncharacterized protein with PQ loop repeat